MSALGVLLPTAPRCSQGIVSRAPLIQQCGECGVTASAKPGTRVGLAIILGGFRFHTCEGKRGIRRCADCNRAALAACPRVHS